MIQCTLLDRIPHTKIRRTTKKDVAHEARKRKFIFAYKLANNTDNRWTKLISEWHPRDKRWEDSFNGMTI